MSFFHNFKHEFIVKINWGTRSSYNLKVLVFNPAFNYTKDTDNGLFVKLGEHDIEMTLDESFYNQEYLFPDFLIFF